MDWMLMPLRRYAQFSGRSQRKEFWLWFVFVMIVSIVASILDRLLGYGRSSVSAVAPGMAAFRSYGPVQLIVFVAFLLPNISVSVRRLHDIDRTGWWVLAPVIPYAVGIAIMVASAFRAASAGQTPGASSFGGLAAGGGIMLIGAILAIVLLVFYCLNGTRGPNRFGPDPKGPDLERTFA